jgi:glutamate 2,3-aminomutase
MSDLGSNRFSQLSKHIELYMKERETLKEQEQSQRKNYELAKPLILEHFKADAERWESWEWQLANRITDSATLAQLIPIDNSRKREIVQAIQFHRMAISPFLLAHFMSLDGQVAKQFIPSKLEIRHQNVGKKDPMAEELTTPVPHITRRYPDRVILKITNICGSYCRFCQRRRDLGAVDLHVPLEELESAFEYISKNQEIRDVLITGGDPLTLTDTSLRRILVRLRQIPTVEIIRIGTRMPIVIPQRITETLLELISEFAPIYINLHINHPLELTPEMKKGCQQLIHAGAVLGSQSVLLKDINDSGYVTRYLCQSLLTVGVRPYYIFHAKDIAGTRHFRTSVSKGVEIVGSLRGFTSGLAIPQFVVNMPGGLGKVPLLPQNYIGLLEDNPILFKTWEQNIVPYSDEVGGLGDD